MLHSSRIGLVIALALSTVPGGFAWGAEVPGEQLEPLPLKLPRPLRLVTPKNIPDNLLKFEKPSTDKRPAFLGPAGCANLALNRPVTSSDEQPLIGNLEMITDGDKEGQEGSWVEMASEKQWVQIDLGRLAALHAILVWHRHDTDVVYKSVVVQVADDAGFTKNVRTLFNNDQDNSLRLGAGKDLQYFETYQGKLIDAKGAQARYVRVWGNGNCFSDLNHFTEIEVWGIAAK